jgi:hypothetical protein
MGEVWKARDTRLERTCLSHGRLGLDPENRTGTRLGPYEILGAGGMGKVYKAKDTRLESTVAFRRGMLKSFKGPFKV